MVGGRTVHPSGTVTSSVLGNKVPVRDEREPKDLGESRRRQDGETGLQQEQLITGLLQSSKKNVLTLSVLNIAHLEKKKEHLKTILNFFNCWVPLWLVFGGTFFGPDVFVCKPPRVWFPLLNVVFSLTHHQNGPSALNTQENVAKCEYRNL